MDDEKWETHSPKYYGENTRLSIEAAQTFLLRVAHTRSQRRDTIRNYLIAAIGLVLSIVSLVGITGRTIDVPPSDLLIWIASMLVHHTMYAGLLGVVLLFATMVFAELVPIERFSSVRDVIRILQPWSFAILIIFLIGVASLSLVALYVVVS